MGPPKPEGAESQEVLGEGAEGDWVARSHRWCYPLNPRVQPVVDPPREAEQLLIVLDHEPEPPNGRVESRRLGTPEPVVIQVGVMHHRRDLVQRRVAKRYLCRIVSNEHRPS